MVKPTDLNIKGQVIVPLPSLVQAMARKKLSFIESDFKKNLYAPAFGRLMNDLYNGLQYRKDDEGQFHRVNSDFILNVNGYAKLTSFETFEYHPRYDNVNFTLGDGSNWSRPYNFEIYSVTPPKPFERSVLVNDNTRMGYYFVKVDSKAASKENSFLGDLSAKEELADIEMMNRRTTNAFIRKFGVAIENPDLQSNLDYSSSLIKSLTK